MILSGADIDPKILDALDNGDLVIFAGAGISMGAPCNLDDFVQLAKKIGEGTGIQFLDDDKDYPEIYMGKLRNKGVDIIDRLHEKLPKPNSYFNQLHENLIRLFSDAENCRIITTNYDLFLEKAFKVLFQEHPKVYTTPALPLGKDFKGIVHLHGALHGDKKGIVLTDDDFGRAYLTEGWARRFLQDVFENNTVLFVGYSHDDTVIKYLARGLPPSNQNKRYVLTGKCDEHDHWDHLGIKPFVFPQKDTKDFSKLYSTTKKLADLSTRGALDIEKRISEIVSSPSQLDEETESHLEWYLSKEYTVRFFRNHAKGIEWLEWADKKGYLEFIFKQNKLTEKEKILAEWFSEFCLKNHQLTLKIFSSRPTKPNEEVIRIIAHVLIFAGEQNISRDAYSAWFTVLEPYISDWYHSLHPDLFEKLEKIGSHEILISLFNTISKPQPKISPRISFGFAREKGRLINLDIDFYGEYYLVNLSFQNHIKPNLEIYSYDLLDCAIQNLKKAYCLNKTWGKANENFDPLGLRRSAIEPHDQDEYPEVIDVLIDSARDTLEFLIAKNPDYSIYKIKTLLRNESKLIQRIAIHALCEVNDLTAKEKLNWVIENNWLADIRLKHEVYRLISIIYPELTNENKEAALNKFYSDIEGCYKDSELEEDDKKRDITYLKYNLLLWLQKHDERCDIIRSKLNEILEKYPDFKPREHLDLTSWISTGADIPSSNLFDKDELLSKTPEKALNYILDKLSEREYYEGSRLYQLTEACKKDEDWGKDFAKELQDKKIKDSTIIDSVLNAWVEQGLNTLLNGEYYDFISDENIQKFSIRSLTHHLQSLSENEDVDLNSEELNKFETLVNALWKYTDGVSVGLESSSWLERAINHPAGNLILTWIKIISIDQKLHDEGSDISIKILTERFEKIIVESTDSGKYGKAILGSQFAYLLFVNSNWTSEKLLPLFDFGDTDNAEILWDGWLGWGRLNLQNLEILLPYYKKAITRLAQDDYKQSRKFASHIADITLFVVEDPVFDILKVYFAGSSIKSRVNLIQQISNRLSNLVPEKKEYHWEKWIKDFIHLRAQSVLEKLTSGEYNGILNWIVNLEPVFEDAVNSFVVLEPFPFDHSLVFHNLLNSDLIDNYPNSVIKLSLHILKADLENYFCYQLKKIYNKLNDIDKSNELYAELGDRLAEMGCI